MKKYSGKSFSKFKEETWCYSSFWFGNMQYSFYSLQLYVLWNVPSFGKGNR